MAHGNPSPMTEAAVTPSSMMRRIRSFVRREARFTEAQKEGLTRYLQTYGVPAGHDNVDLAAHFDKQQPIILEIGFGNGEALLHQAKTAPQYNYMGLEVHRPGVGRFLNALAADGLSNVRVCSQDAVEFLDRLPNHSLHGVQIFFPDPWPKKRHQKRRLIQASLLSTLLRVLVPGGFVHCATDWEDYAQHMLAVFNEQPNFKNTSADSSGFIPRPDRFLSHFEARGLALGHVVRDLFFINSL